MLFYFLLLESVNLYVTSVGFSIIWYGPLRIGCNFFEISHCIEIFGITTNLAILKSDADVKL